MSIIDDERLNLAVAEALQSAMAETAESRALAMLTLASSPASTKQRLDELLAATAASNAAREAAERAAEAASSAAAADRDHANGVIASADERIAELGKREAEFLAWSESEGKRLKQADAAIRLGEAANAQRAGEIADRERAVDARLAEHAALIERMRQHVAAHDAEASK